MLNGDHIGDRPHSRNLFGNLVEKVLRNDQTGEGSGPDAIGRSHDARPLDTFLTGMQR